MKERRARPSIVYLPSQHNFFICQDFSNKYTSTNNRWRQNIDISLSLSSLLSSYGSWINVLLWHNVQMDVTFVMEATLINNIKFLGSYDFHWKRNQNVQKHKVPSFVKSWPRSNSPQLKTLKIYLKKLPNCINSPFNRVSSVWGGVSQSRDDQPGKPSSENPKSQSFWIAPILWSGVGRSPSPLGQMSV